MPPEADPNLQDPVFLDPSFADPSLAGDVGENINEAPVITSPATTPYSKRVSSGAVSVLTVHATGYPVPTYSITGGDDAALFSVDSDAGQLTFDSPPDFDDPQDLDTDNIYEVQVTATNTEDTDLVDLLIEVTSGYSEYDPQLHGMQQYMQPYV